MARLSDALRGPAAMTLLDAARLAVAATIARADMRRGVVDAAGYDAHEARGLAWIVDGAKGARPTPGADR